MKVFFLQDRNYDKCSWNKGLFTLRCSFCSAGCASTVDRTLLAAFCPGTVCVEAFACTSPPRPTALNPDYNCCNWLSSREIAVWPPHPCAHLLFLTPVPTRFSLSLWPPHFFINISPSSQPVSLHPSLLLQMHPPASFHPVHAHTLSVVRTAFLPVFFFIHCAPLSITWQLFYHTSFLFFHFPALPPAVGETGDLLHA